MLGLSLADAKKEREDKCPSNFLLLQSRSNHPQCGQQVSKYASNYDSSHNFMVIQS